MSYLLPMMTTGYPIHIEKTVSWVPLPCRVGHVNGMTISFHFGGWPVPVAVLQCRVHGLRHLLGSSIKIPDMVPAKGCNAGLPPSARVVKVEHAMDGTQLAVDGRPGLSVERAKGREGVHTLDCIIVHDLVVWLCVLGVCVGGLLLIHLISRTCSQP